MPVDIDWLEWCGLVDTYISTGKTKDLERILKKVREEGVPKEFGDQIADMLAGKLKPDYTSNELKSYDKKQLYLNFLSYRKQIKGFEAQLYGTYKPMIAAGIKTNPIKSSSVSKKMLYKLFAREFCQDNLNTARTFIRRKIDAGEWPPFPD